MNLTSRVAASGRERYEDKTCVCDFVIKTQRWYQSTAVFTHFLIVRCLVKLSLCLLECKTQDCDDKIDLLKPHIAKEKQEALSRDMMAAEMSI